MYWHVRTLVITTALSSLDFPLCMRNNNQCLKCCSLPLSLSLSLLPSSLFLFLITLLPISLSHHRVISTSPAKTPLPLNLVLVWTVPCLGEGWGHYQEEAGTTVFQNILHSHLSIPIPRSTVPSPVVAAVVEVLTQHLYYPQTWDWVSPL